MLYNGFGEHLDHGISALLVFVEMKPALKDDIRLKKLLEDFSLEQVVRGGILFSLQGGTWSSKGYFAPELNGCPVFYLPSHSFLKCESLNAEFANTDAGMESEVPDFALEALTELMGQKSISHNEYSKATPTGSPPKGVQQKQPRSQPRKVNSLPFSGIEKRCSKKQAKWKMNNI